MNRCSYCGTTMTDKDRFCPGCGKTINYVPTYSGYPAIIKQKPSCPVPPNAILDSGSPWWAIFGYFFTLIGIVLYFAWRKDRPKNAKSVGIGVLAAFIMFAVVIALEIIILVPFLFLPFVAFD